jgi:serine/threonine-protein kinase
LGLVPLGQSCKHSPLPVNATEGLCPRCVFEQLKQKPGASDQTFAATVASAAPESGVRPGGRNQHPERFGDYELLEEIARGGMGVIYKAPQISLNRTVAVKMILAGEFAGKQVTRRFQGEAAAAVLQHPNIVAVHEVGVQQGRHFFPMDYVQGQNLAQLVGNRPLPSEAAARYLKIIVTQQRESLAAAALL